MCWTVPGISIDWGKKYKRIAGRHTIFFFHPHPHGLSNARRRYIVSFDWPELQHSTGKAHSSTIDPESLRSIFLFCSGVFCRVFFLFFHFQLPSGYLKLPWIHVYLSLLWCNPAWCWCVIQCRACGILFLIYRRENFEISIVTNKVWTSKPSAHIYNYDCIFDCAKASAKIAQGRRLGLDHVWTVAHSNTYSWIPVKNKSKDSCALLIPSGTITAWL